MSEPPLHTLICLGCGAALDCHPNSAYIEIHSQKIHYGQDFGFIDITKDN